MAEMQVRVRGKIGEIAEPIEDKGKFLFFVFVMVGGVEDKEIEIGPFGPFDTEEIAKRELEKEGISIVKMVKEDIGGLKDGTYFDMKDGGQVKNYTVH